jgi:hypothetical protein
MTSSRLKSRVQDAPAEAHAPADPVKNIPLEPGSAPSMLSHANFVRSSQAQVLPDQKTGSFRFGIPELDSLTGGIPRGAITEILGPAGSGRAALMLSALAHSTASRELCALVDADMLDVASAAAAGIDLDRLLWVRCPEVVGDALKATELLLRSGCFGLVALDLTGISAKQANHISSACWIRFRRAIENGRTGLLVMEAYPCARAAAALALKLSSEQAIWEESSESLEGSEGLRRRGEPRSRKDSIANTSNKGLACSNLLRAIKLTAERTKPYLYGSPSGRAATSAEFIISIPH